MYRNDEGWHAKAGKDVGVRYAAHSRLLHVDAFLQARVKFVLNRNSTTSNDHLVLIIYLAVRRNSVFIACVFIIRTLYLKQSHTKVTESMYRKWRDTR